MHQNGAKDNVELALNGACQSLPATLRLTA